MIPTGTFFKSKLNGLRGKIYKCLGGKGWFMVYQHKKCYFLLPVNGKRKKLSNFPLYYFDTKIYHETFIRFLSLKARYPGSEKISRNYSSSPQAKVSILLPWKCPNTIVCPYLAAIR